MNRMKILLSAVLVFAATASIAQDFSDPRYAPWGDTPEQRKHIGCGPTPPQPAMPG